MEDPRCCGSGACIIDAAGQCWCGQVWDGTKMCHPPLDLAPVASRRVDESAALPDAVPDGPAPGPAR